MNKACTEKGGCECKDSRGYAQVVDSQPIRVTFVNHGPGAACRIEQKQALA